jgi:hypothetical protein
MEGLFPSLRTRRYRIWSGGIVAVLAAGGAIALVIAIVMWATDTTIH